MKRGTVHALIGPNGAGKTTFFNLLTRMLSVTSGRILYKGRDIQRMLKPHDVASLGIVRSFQISATFPHLTARENVRIALQRFRGDCYAFWRSDAVFNTNSTTAPTRFSPRSGSKALPIAAKLPNCPMAASGRWNWRRRSRSTRSCLLLDEPTAGMAHEDIGRIVALIRQVAASRTVIMVEHNLSVVARSLPSHHRDAARRDTRRPRLAAMTRSRAIRPSSRLIWALAPMTDGAVLETARGRGFLRQNFASSARRSICRCGAAEIVTLIGRNGVGKTTTLRAIMGIPAQAPRLAAGDGRRDRTAWPPERIARLGVGYVPEERGIFASLSVIENFLLPPRLKPLAACRIDEIYALFPQISRSAPRAAKGARLLRR